VPKFTTRPQTVEAVQHVGPEGLAEVFYLATGKRTNAVQCGTGVTVYGVGAVQHADPGDWIVRDAAGVVTVQTAPEFERLYQPFPVRD
jgi:hypothetical protein